MNSKQLAKTISLATIQITKHKSTFFLFIISFDVNLVYIYTKRKIMARQSISFTEPNDDWLKRQIANKEYSSKSELVNDLIRQARKQQKQIDWINSKLEKAEKSGFTSDNSEQILAKSKSQLNG